VSCSPFALGGDPSWGTLITMEEETAHAGTAS
jgi:hypothetical protein